MEGRKQKAREGKWNGGFAPIGYSLDNEELVVNEDGSKVETIITQIISNPIFAKKLKIKSIFK